MRIRYLKLVNFLHIYSGLNKTEIELDFRKSAKTINIIIGKMGSGKSVILGHLQPFASFGTLDARNQDGIIIEGEDGKKIIEYQVENTVYHIEHVYQWKRDHHSVKSYITKNGEELNPNGNVSSFKSLIELELGLNQSDLSLLRLGPNVTNLIDMSAAARKSYMASRLKDAELYAILYKRLNEDMRNINAQASLLTNKITSLTKGSVADMLSEQSSIEKNIRELQTQLHDSIACLGGYDSELKRIFKGRSIQMYDQELEMHEAELQSTTQFIEKTSKEIREVQDNFHSFSEVAENLGSVKASLSHNTEELLHLDDQYKQNDLQLSKLQEKQLILCDKEQLSNMKKTYQELLMKLQEMEKELQDFRCKYATPQIRALLAQLNTMNALISDINSYNYRTIMRILQNGGAALKEANTRIDHLERRRRYLQRELSNLKFADSYQPSETLYFPPFCPTHDCPYYKTHPVTVKEAHNGVDKRDEFDALQQSIEKCEKEIDEYTEYPIVYSKVQALREMWPDAVQQLEDIHAIKTKSIVKVFSNMFDMKWYDHDKVVDVLNLCVLRDKYYELSEKTQAMRSEIDSMDRNNSEGLSEKISFIQNTMKEEFAKITSLEKQNSVLKQQQELLEKAYHKLMMLEESMHEVEDATLKVNALKELVCAMRDDRDKAKSIRENANNENRKKIHLESTIRDLQAKANQIAATLNDLDYSKAEFEKVQVAQSYLKDIVEAVSSNKGIPLVYIKLFLNQCKDTVNDLISDVFGDSIEILDFDITETDFKIPYAINGSPVKDISSASQGQRAIISLALSFALVRQAMSHYNIMLLDEMDGPLYKDDREKFISILFKQIQAINAEQIFIVSHNNTFDGHNVNIIMTTDEHVDKSRQITIMHV